MSPVGKPSPYVMHTPLELLLSCVYSSEVAGFITVVVLLSSGQFFSASMPLAESLLLLLSRMRIYAF
jgi:hypothetical protein